MKTAQQVLNELIIYIEQRKGNSLDGYQESNDKFIQQMYMGENTAYGMVLMEINKLLDQSPVAPVVSKSAENEMTADKLYYILTKVSLLDLSGCEFEHDADENESWVNAVFNGNVIDTIVYDGNLFKIMNNDESFNYLNPMKSAFDAMNEYAASVVLPCVGEKEKYALSLLIECDDEYLCNDVRLNVKGKIEMLKKLLENNSTTSMGEGNNNISQY